jgi:ureidoglycolate hydrolase
MSPSATVRSLLVQPLTPEAFAPFGQVICPTPDGQPFGPEDAQLRLDKGIPRFYLMQLDPQGRRFHRITRHQRCTQCLGALEGKEWLIAVAPSGARAVPNPEEIRAFRIPGNCFIKLEVGTWHAGPLFEGEPIGFYNLELSDTNITDHDTCDLVKTFGLAFELV